MLYYPLFRFFVLHHKECKEITIEHKLVEKVLKVVQDKIDRAKAENNEIEEEMQINCLKKSMDVMTQEIMALKEKIKAA